MNSSGLVTQHDLLKWADSISARAELPRLIRRLVLETGDQLSSVDFPAGEGVSVGGWDGVVRAGTKAPFVPEGLSLWELSVDKAVNKKANEDFEKRLETPDGSSTDQATYCQLAVRRWADRRDWQKTKTRNGRWLAVRAFGVDYLETWLESAPVTHAWISEQLGLLPYGLRTAEAWWRTWSQATAPALTPGIVLAGRGAQADELASRLRGGPQVTSLSTGSLDEALAFIAALALEQDYAGTGDLLARTVFVDQLQTWRRLADTTKPLIMVPGTGELINEAHSAPAHHVVVPLTTGACVDVELPPVDAAEAAAALKEAGLPDARADAAGTLGRRNLLALRRNLAVKPELHQPTWARPPISRLVRGCLLAGTWQDNAPGDRDALARFVGRPYDELREDLDLLAAEADPLVIRVGATWTVVSLFDGWRQLERQIRSDDLDRFREICIEALLERDPRFGMDQTDRMLASTRGIAERRVSGDLRDGLVASLALLGVAGARVLPDGVANGSSYARRIVRELLTPANDDETGELLIGLAHHLDLLAEAAPDVLVEGIKGAVRGDQPLILKMFQDHEGTDPLFSGGSAHTGLLWALETLAWSPEHFADAIYLLADLAEFDPGGRYSNRPQASLREIFCPWRPETTAMPSRRLAVLKEVGRRRPNVAWPLLLGLLPQVHGVHHPSSAPRFRDWKPEKSSVTRREFWEITEAIADQAIEAAGTQPDRWAELVDRADSLPPQKHQEVSFALRELVRKGQLDEAGRHELWEKLRAHVARHREFSDAPWARSEEDLQPLDEVIEQLAPADTLVAWEWLFAESFPDLGEGLKNRGEDGFDHDAYTAALEERRRGAIAEILAQHGFDGAVRLAQSSGAAWWVGSALAEVAPQGHERGLLDLLGQEDASRAVATGYFSRRFAEGGWTAIDRAITDERLSPPQHGRLLLCGDASPEAWHRAADAGEKVAAVYWQALSPYGLGPQFPHVAEAARRMLDYGNVTAALRMLALHARKNDDIGLAPLVIEALDALLALDAAQMPEAALREYDFTTLFEFLESHRDLVGLPEVARLEWAYLPALGFEPSAPTLHEALAQDPSLFVGTLEIVYRHDASADEPHDLDEREQQMAQNGYQLLDSWHHPPGKNADGSFDGATLRKWVDAALTGADVVGRRRSAERQIGRMLRYTPPDQDGAWPNEPVRDLLEALDSDRVDDALAMEVYNSRGVTSRNPTDGGEQERALAETYRAHIADVADRWPRSAAILRGLAEDYEADARQHDAEAERVRGGLDR